MRFTRTRASAARRRRSAYRPRGSQSGFTGVGQGPVFASAVFRSSFVAAGAGGGSGSGSSVRSPSGGSSAS